MNAYEPQLTDTDGGMLCRDCLTWCYFGTPAPPCDVDGCGCERCQAARRAVELDNRPDEKLAVIANELDRERVGDPRELQAERYGRRP